MENEHQFLTIKGFLETKLKEKNSLFIAQSYPIENEDEFQKILIETKKKYYDATHHCYAFKLQNNIFKYSDDGEPNGTAGIRILNAIDHFDLINVAGLVIRYFGGTKLGVGPLGKTYYESIFQNLHKAKKIYKTEYQKIKIQVDFEFVSLVHRILSSIDAKIDSTNYENNVEFIYFIKPADFDNVKQKLMDNTHGKVLVNVDDGHTYF